MIKLVLKPLPDFPRIPIQAPQITPDKLCELDPSQILSLELIAGGRKIKLDQVFHLELIPGDAERILIQGDCSRIKRIGEGMTRGEIIIQGSVGMHCGAEMKAGRILIQGNAGDWLGREMISGEIIVEGDAGSHVGAGYWGATPGIRSGRIWIKGNAGDYLGEMMSGGEIIVEGNSGLFPGFKMSGGKIMIHGSGIYPGAEMLDGEIQIGRARMLPTFKQLGKLVIDGKEYFEFQGDEASGGKGKIRVEELLD